MNIEREYLGDYIQGHFVKPKDPHGEIESFNPGDLDEERIEFPFYYEHINEAISTASRRFKSWRRMPLSDRKTAIKRYRDLLAERSDKLATAISFEIGKPLWEARIEVKESLVILDYFLDNADQIECEKNIALTQANHGVGKVRYFPIGVVAILSPANKPVYSPHCYLVPALLHGNTVILKTSKYAPYTGQCVAEILHDAGLPAGTLNVLHGSSEVARRLVSHKDVSGVFFTGPYERALKIQKQTSSHISKLVVLNTGGKNGAVIWNDSNYDKALYETLNAAYISSGQRCRSTSRILVHDEIFSKFLKDFHTLAKKCTVDFGLVEGTKAPFMGPLVSESAVEHYLRYQGIGVREGCEEIMRGKHLEREKRGYYVSPSIQYVMEPNPKSIYQNEDIGGPNVAIFRVKDVDEATEILNHPNYGLVASIYTNSRKNFMAFVDESNVGVLHWNQPTIANDPHLPYGGVKISGNYRPMGSYAFQNLTYPMSSLETADAGNTPQVPEQTPRLE